MKVFLSTVIGLMIGYILGIPRCDSHGPNSNDVKKYIYYDQRSGKYYKYRTDIVICPSYLR